MLYDYLNDESVQLCDFTHCLHTEFLLFHDG